MQRYTIVKTVMKSLKSHQRLLIFLLSVLALTCVIAWSTFALAVFIARMMKRVLRAVDLASRK